MNIKTTDRLCVFSLKMLAAMFDIPGGADAMERLLLAAGFLTGAYRSNNPHLPYQRYLDLGYFLVIEKEVPTRYKAYTFCVTNKGLGPVSEKLKTLGVQMSEAVDF